MRNEELLTDELIYITSEIKKIMSKSLDVHLINVKYFVFTYQKLKKTAPIN